MTPREMLRRRSTTVRDVGIAVAFVGILMVGLTRGSHWELLGALLILVGMLIFGIATRVTCPRCLGTLHGMGDNQFRGGANHFADTCRHCGLKMDEEWDGVSVIGQKGH